MLRQNKTIRSISWLGLSLITIMNTACATTTVKVGCEEGNDQQMATLLANASMFANPPAYDFRTQKIISKNTSKEKQLIEISQKKDGQITTEIVGIDQGKVTIIEVSDQEIETFSSEFAADLQVQYQQINLAGCEVNLRQYAGSAYDDRPVGPTMIIAPGQQYEGVIINQLTDEANHNFDVRQHRGHDTHESVGGHGGNSTILGYVSAENPGINHNRPHDFNVTNLHTHGWHVDPTRNSDNIFAAIGPGDLAYVQQVQLPDNHVAGSFWYHAHVHGSTTIQVASGMAGALVVKDPTKGLDAIPAIAQATEQLFVFQQLAYGTDGKIENYDNLQQRGYGALNRPIFVNGQAYPKLEVTVDEVQRWRFIHAGITDGINPQLIHGNLSTNNIVPLYEIALDGLPTGTMIPINNAVLSPGYRTDVLAQFNGASIGDTYYLVDSNQQPEKTVGQGDDKKVIKNLRYVLAQITVVAGQAQATMLPTAKAIVQAKQDYIYGSYQAGTKDPYKTIGPLNDVIEKELVGKQQTVHFMASKKYSCPQIGGSCTPCLDQQGALTICEEYAKSTDSKLLKQSYMTCDGKQGDGFWNCMNFNPDADYARTLALDTASQWTVSGDTGQNNHTFHIHVNPFQVQRQFVYGSGDPFPNAWVWKDTLRAPTTSGDVGAAILKSRYTEFTGAFVQHCHVLNHEDQGMMQVVEIRPSLADLLENPQFYNIFKEE